MRLVFLFFLESFINLSKLNRRHMVEVEATALDCRNSAQSTLVSSIWSEEATGQMSRGRKCLAHLRSSRESGFTQ